MQAASSAARCEISRALELSQRYHERQPQCHHTFQLSSTSRHQQPPAAKRTQQHAGRSSPVMARPKATAHRGGGQGAGGQGGQDGSGHSG